MRETGVIISEEKQKVTIQMVKGDKCKDCNLCETTGPNQMQVEALNNINAHVGDLVEFEVPPAKVLGSSFLIFIVPVLFMIAGYFIGTSFFGPQSGEGEGAGILGSIFGFVLSMILLKFFDSQLGQDTNPAIVINKISS